MMAQEKKDQIAEGSKNDKAKKNIRPFKKMSREEVVAANTAVINGLLGRAVNSFEKLDKLGKIPDEIARKNGSRHKVNREGLRDFCKRFREGHEKRMNVMREMKAKSGHKTEEKAKEADVK
jgi:hypothetical protein